MQIFFVSILFFILLWIIAYGILLFAKETCQIFFWNGVPYIKTNDETTTLFMKNLELKDNDVFIDIGCRDGKILESVSKKFPKNKVIWFEISPRPYKNALTRKKKNKLHYDVFHKNFFETSISDGSVFYSYTIWYIMKDTREKIKHDCKKGTRLYSNYFQVPEVIPSQIMKWANNQNIYLYIL